MADCENYVQWSVFFIYWDHNVEIYQQRSALWQFLAFAIWVCTQNKNKSEISLFYRDCKNVFWTKLGEAMILWSFVDSLFDSEKIQSILLVRHNKKSN